MLTATLIFALALAQEWCPKDVSALKCSSVRTAGKSSTTIHYSLDTDGCRGGHLRGKGLPTISSVSGVCVESYPADCSDKNYGGEKGSFTTECTVKQKKGFLSTNYECDCAVTRPAGQQRLTKCYAEPEATKKWKKVKEVKYLPYFCEDRPEGVPPPIDEMIDTCNGDIDILSEYPKSMRALVVSICAGKVYPTTNEAMVALQGPYLKWIKENEFAGFMTVKLVLNPTNEQADALYNHFHGQVLAHAEKLKREAEKEAKEEAKRLEKEAKRHK